MDFLLENISTEHFAGSVLLLLVDKLIIAHIRKPMHKNIITLWNTFTSVLVVPYLFYTRKLFPALLSFSMIKYPKVQFQC